MVNMFKPFVYTSFSGMVPYYQFSQAFLAHNSRFGLSVNSATMDNAWGNPDRDSGAAQFIKLEKVDETEGESEALDCAVPVDTAVVKVEGEFSHNNGDGQINLLQVCDHLPSQYSSTTDLADTVDRVEVKCEEEIELDTGERKADLLCISDHLPFQQGETNYYAGTLSESTASNSVMDDADENINKDLTTSCSACISHPETPLGEGTDGYSIVGETCPLETNKIQKSPGMCQQCSTGFDSANTASKDICSIQRNKKGRVYQGAKKTSLYGRELNVQLQSNSGERPFGCKTCNKAFSRAADLKVHIRSHTGEKPYVCQECNKAFSQSSNMNVHLRTHSGTKPYVCQECNKSFSRAADVKAHLRTHSGERPYVCQECEKSFSRAFTLKVHLRTHSGERPYMCQECNKSFSSVSDLKVHLRTHSGEKPYVCQECNRAFLRSFTLKSHFRTHSGEKPYVCEECNKSFAQSSHLKVHLRTHSGEKP